MIGAITRSTSPSLPEKVLIMFDLIFVPFATIVAEESDFWVGNYSDYFLVQTSHALAVLEEQHSRLLSHMNKRHGIELLMAGRVA